MKNTFLAIIIAVLFIFAFAPVIKNVNYYATTAEVVEIDRKADEVTFRTWAGFDYKEKGAEDWFIGDVAALCMDDRGTEFIDDDKIVSVRYTRVDFDSPSRDISFAQKLQGGK